MAYLPWYRGKDATIQKSPKSLNFGHSYTMAYLPRYCDKDATMLDTNICFQMLKSVMKNVY